MSKNVMTQALCAAGYEPLAQEGPVYVANNGNPSEYLEELRDAQCVVVRIGHMNRAEMDAAPNLRVAGRASGTTALTSPPPRSGASRWSSPPAATPIPWRSTPWR